MDPLTGALILGAAILWAYVKMRHVDPAEVGSAAQLGFNIDPATGGVVGSATTKSNQARDQSGKQYEWVGRGAGIGAYIGGPGGAFVGGGIGALVGAVDAFRNFKDPREPGPLVDLGMPFNPGTVDAATLKLTVPTANGDPAYIAFALDDLRKLFPGKGALEACIESGMMRWRPRDQDTPFSQALYASQIGPFLRAYEADNFRDTPIDYTASDGEEIRWQDLHHVMWRQKPWDYSLYWLQLRRAFFYTAWLNRPLANDSLAAEWAVYLWNMGWRHEQDTTIPGTDPSNRRKYNYLYQVITFMSGLTGSGIDFDDDTRDAGIYEPPTPPPYEAAGSVNRGFEGAWHLVDMPPEDNTPPIQVGTGRGGIAVGLTAPIGVRWRAPDPENAFAFRVWMPWTETGTGWGVTDVRSSQFADLFGSHAAARKALEAGQLAWGGGLADKVSARWNALYPHSLEARPGLWSHFS